MDSENTKDIICDKCGTKIEILEDDKSFMKILRFDKENKNPKNRFFFSFLRHNCDTNTEKYKDFLKKQEEREKIKDKLKRSEYICNLMQYEENANEVSENKFKQANRCLKTIFTGQYKHLKQEDVELIKNKSNLEEPYFFELLYNFERQQMFKEHKEIVEKFKDDETFHFNRIF